MLTLVRATRIHADQSPNRMTRPCLFVSIQLHTKWGWMVRLWHPTAFHPSEAGRAYVSRERVDERNQDHQAVRVGAELPEQDG